MITASSSWMVAPSPGLPNTNMYLFRPLSLSRCHSPAPYIQSTYGQWDALWEKWCGTKYSSPAGTVSLLFISLKAVHVHVFSTKIYVGEKKKNETIRAVLKIDPFVTSLI